MSRGEAQDLSGLSPWADELARTFVSLASDIALVLDEHGVITHIAQSGAEPVAPAASAWIGRPWVETVSGDTRRKIELLLQDVRSTGLARRREVNHPGAGGDGIPVAYTAIRLGQGGPVLAVGRDLRAVAAIQQRFIDHQQELERGYWQLRRAETREQRLQQVAGDAVFVVDGATLAIVRANEIGAQVFGREPQALAGQPLPVFFDAHSRAPVEELLSAARSSGRPVEIRARLAGKHSGIGVTATPFRADGEQRLLVRVRAVETVAPAAPAVGAALIVDSSGRILSGSAGFVALSGVADEAGLRGRSLAEWLGNSGFESLVDEVRHAGIATRAELTLALGPRTGQTLQASAELLTEGDQECIGIRLSVGPAGGNRGVTSNGLDHAIGELDQRLGHIALADMLREATALAERHFIELAVARSGGDADVAARLLGLSREALGRRRQRSRRRAAGA